MSALLRVWLLVMSIVLLAPGAARAAAPTLGDFNGDGFSDLAVGASFEELGATIAAGAVNVIYGGPGGLSAVGNQFWQQGTVGTGQTASSGDYFSEALAAGDFDGDGIADLAIGAPGDDAGIPFASSAGAVTVLYGAPGGLGTARSRLWTQESLGIKDSAERGDGFGSALAAGDFNGDGRDELAISAYREDVGSPSVVDAGVVHVLLGGAAGLSAAGNQLWHQDQRGMLDQIERNDFFGTALGAGDFDGDGRDDLAVGIANEDLGAVGGDAGAVQVIRGGAGGLSAPGNQFWHRDSRGIKDVATESDRFGSSVAAGDFNGDGRDDLVVGVPGPLAVEFGRDPGAVHVLYGGASGLSATGNQAWDANSRGIYGTGEVGDSFGDAVAAGDFDRDGRDGLAVGVPRGSGVVTCSMGPPPGCRRRATSSGARTVTACASRSRTAIASVIR